MKDLSNKVAVVTGAASGIGRSLAVNLAKEGCILALLDINANGLDETVKLLQSEKAVSTHVVDVANRALFHQTADEIIQQYGHVDIVINNAGGSVLGALATISYRDLDWIMGINLGGVIHGIKAFLPHMIKRKQGHIVNVCSGASYVSTPLMGSYAATKFATRSLTETLFMELRGTGVSVTGVYPGGIKTNLAKNSRMDKGFDTENGSLIESVEKTLTTTADHAAKKIVRAIKKDKFRLFIGIDGYLLYFFERIAPTLTLMGMHFFFKKVIGEQLDNGNTF